MKHVRAADCAETGWRVCTLAHSAYAELHTKYLTEHLKEELKE